MGTNTKRSNSERADSVPDFGLGMKRSSQFTGGLVKWKGEIGDGVQDLCSEALFPQWSSLRNVEESTERD